MITIKNLTKQYSNIEVFNELNLIINPGDFIALTGDSGCGKSTLLNMIGCIDTNYQGEISVNSLKISKLRGEKKQKFIRDHINYLFQNYALVDDKSVHYNLMLALKYTKYSNKEKEHIIYEILDSINLLNKIDSKIYSLSGGEQQRISLARSIIKPGSILLADEPTGNLDDNNAQIIMSLLRKYHTDDRIVIIATHDDSVVKKCDRVIHLNNDQKNKEEKDR